MRKPKVDTLYASKPAVSTRLSSFKKAVFRVVETNESIRQDPLSSSRSKGYTDVESIDGDYRFKVGIIDFLTEYNTFKNLENVFKSTIHHVDQKEVSAIDSSRYQARFVQFIN
jgi:hypothetical protein